MNSIRIRLLLALLAILAAAAAVLGGFTYHNVLVETEALFDYQLRQMALSLRDQGEIDPSQAQALADGQLDFVVQIWNVDGPRETANKRNDERVVSFQHQTNTEITGVDGSWYVVLPITEDAVILCELNLRAD